MSLATKQPTPSFAIEHPKETTTHIYGVGIANNYLQAKARALNDISTQIKIEVRSISSIERSSENKESKVSENITMLTSKKVSNYTILKEKLVNEKYYMLIRYNK